MQASRGGRDWEEHRSSTAGGVTGTDWIRSVCEIPDSVKQIRRIPAESSAVLIGS
jgi:hypothetical protein